MVPEIDFRLTIQPEGEVYRIRCNTGGKQTTEWIAPTNLAIVAEMAHALNGSGITQADICQMGQFLFDSVITRSINHLYTEALTQARAQRTPLRVVVQSGGGQPDILQELPWEAMHDAEGFMSRQPSIPFVRAQGSSPASPMPVPPSPVRILLTTSSGSESAFSQETDLIRQALASYGSHIRIFIKKGLSLEGLRASLHAAAQDDQPIHIWHHVGRGEIQLEEGRFALRLDGAEPVVAHPRIAPLLRKYPQLRLTILNLSFEHVPTGLAACLPFLGCPAVIAYRGRGIPPPFTQTLYRSLFATSIEQAVAHARRHLAESYQRSTKWLLPVCFLRPNALTWWRPPPPPPPPETSLVVSLRRADLEEELAERQEEFQGLKKDRSGTLSEANRVIIARRRDYLLSEIARIEGELARLGRPDANPAPAAPSGGRRGVVLDPEQIATQTWVEFGRQRIIVGDALARWRKLEAHLATSRSEG